MENKIVLWTVDGGQMLQVTSLIHPSPTPRISGSSGGGNGVVTSGAAVEEEKSVTSTDSYPIEQNLDVNLSHQTISVTSISIPPPSISFLKSSLKCLQLQGNALSVLPREIFLLQGLEELNISFNLITKIPIEIGHLTRLRDFHMNKNKVKNLPQTIGDCKDLTVLDVSGNNLKFLPVEILLCTKLRNLWVDENDFMDDSSKAPSTPLDPNTLVADPPLVMIPTLVELSLQAIASKLFPASNLNNNHSNSGNIQDACGEIPALLQRQKSQTGSALGNLELPESNDQDFKPQNTTIVERLMFEEDLLVKSVERENIPFTLLPLLRYPMGLCSNCGTLIYFRNGARMDSFIIGIPFTAHVFKADRLIPVNYSLCSFKCLLKVSPSKAESSRLINDNSSLNNPNAGDQANSLRSSRSRTF